MSWTQRSVEFKPTKLSGTFISRDNSVSSQKSKRKGISLSKEHDQTYRGKSPSYIKVLQKNKKQVLVEKREIKLLLKVKDNEDQIQKSNDKQNKINECNVIAKPEKSHMDILSTEVPDIKKRKEFGKFPLKKTVRKDRGIKNPCQTIQLL